MRRDQVCTDKWVYNLLVNGFSSPADERNDGGLKSYRAERLKHMVLNSIFRDYDGLKRRRMSSDGTPRV
jgi:hypothetical protein